MRSRRALEPALAWELGRLSRLRFENLVRLGLLGLFLRLGLLLLEKLLRLGLLGALGALAAALAAAAELAVLGLLVGRGRHFSPDARELSLSGRHKSHGEGGGEEDGGGESLHYFLRSIGFYDDTLTPGLLKKVSRFLVEVVEREKEERARLVTFLEVDSTKPELG
jgi:hypothetical protein